MRTLRFSLLALGVSLLSVVACFSCNDDDGRSSDGGAAGVAGNVGGSGRGGSAGSGKGGAGTGSLVMNGYSKLGNPILDIVRGLDGEPVKDADGFTYPTLVFGNGPNRSDLRSNVDSAVALGAEYLQPSAVRTAVGSETHGGGDVMLLADGAGAKAFKGTLENVKVFDLVKSACGL